MKLTIGEEYGDKTALLENKNGLILSLHAHGASIRKISVPDKNGTEIFFTMSYARESEYTSENHGNNGRTLAPNAGEVSEAEGIRFTNGDEVHPSANRGGNNLHGGFHRGSDTTWQISDFSAGEESACVTFTLTFADGLDGWEGNRFCSVRYTLDDTDTVRMDFEARSDKKTYINLSNHA